MNWRSRGRRCRPGSVCGLLLPLLLLTSATAVTGQIRAAGVQVVGPGAGENGTELQAFDQRSGTGVALLLSAPEGKLIVAVHDDESAVSSWTDDKGSNLLESVAWDPFPDVTADGSLGLIEVRSEARPAAGATKTTVAGKVAMQVATGTETETVPKLVAAVGEKVETRRGLLEVVAVDTEDAMILTLQATTEIRDSIRDLRFFDGDEEIELNGQGSMSMGGSVQLEYYLGRAADELRLELDWWTGLESVEMPFEVEAGLGLGR